MLTYERSLARVILATPSPRAEAVTLEAALGLVLARPVVAAIDLPRFDNSAVDGYAIRMSESGGNARLARQVIGVAEAGRPFNGCLRESQAVRIFTGAQVPDGADAVVMQEHVRRAGSRVWLKRSAKAGQHIRRRGEDVRRGSRVLEPGTRLRPQELGLLAALGHRAVHVRPRPSVAVLASGDEIRPPGSRLRPGQIFESNTALLGGLIRQAGAEPIRLGLVGDALRPLAAAIRRGLRFDLLIATGGVSVGEKDLLRRALRACGVRPVLWKVNMKPGMPLFVGTRGRSLVFGLPGNPVSVFVTFEEFVRPAIDTLLGRSRGDGYTLPATLAQPLTLSTTRRTHFIRVQTERQDGRLLARPLNGQGSHQLRTLSVAHGWIRLRSDQGPWPAGAPVLVKLEATT